MVGSSSAGSRTGETRPSRSGVWCPTVTSIQSLGSFLLLVGMSHSFVSVSGFCIWGMPSLGAQPLITTPVLLAQSGAELRDVFTASVALQHRNTAPKSIKHELWGLWFYSGRMICRITAWGGRFQVEEALLALTPVLNSNLGDSACCKSPTNAFIGFLAASEASEIMKSIGEAIQYLHSINIAHRDVKVGAVLSPAALLGLSPALPSPLVPCLPAAGKPLVHLQKAQCCVKTH